MCIRDRDEGESVVGIVVTDDYGGNLLFFFEDGKCAKVELAAYRTKQNRRKLTGAYACLLYTSRCV